MKRRYRLSLTGSAGFAALLPGCAIQTDRVKINTSSAAHLGGDDYGIWQDGRWLGGNHPEKRLSSLSITKSLAALAVIRAVGEGWLELDQPGADIIPEWQSDPGKRRVTMRMLVNQTAGFPAGVAALFRRHIHDKGRAAIALPLVDPPGERFRYDPTSNEILAQALRQHLREHGPITKPSRAKSCAGSSSR